MEQIRKPFIIIVSAPSGSGKTTLVSQVLNEMPGVKRSISYTTRAPREGENNNDDYIFVSVEEFKQKIQEDEFLEWEENFGNYYGTSVVQVEEVLSGGDDIILSIDVKGAKKIKEKYPESISVFIMPPSIDELASRLKKRNTDNEGEVIRRLKESKREIEASDYYDYMIVNEKLDKAMEELKNIIKTERKNRENLQR